MQATLALPLAAALITALGACTGEPAATPSKTPDATAPTPSQSPTTEPPEATPKPEPARFEASRALKDVRLLAGEIGPRLATSPAFVKAADLVADRFRDLGYDVQRPTFPVPAGDSWGVPVPAGTSQNVIARPPGFDPAEPYLIVGAHLDTVAVAPGAEDNASGVSVLLEVARLAASPSPVPTDNTRQPIVLIAFGAEEPVGGGDDLHHFGSMHYVRTVSKAERSGLKAMLSLDRVGVGEVVPVCTGPLSPPGVQNDLLQRAKKLGIPARSCELTTSDHWSFEKAGFVVARLGSTPYAGYHSAADRPSVVSGEQLDRVGRLTWDWLRAR